MNSLIFLGIIPGTNIQISFFGWLVLSALALSFFLVIRHRKNIISGLRKNSKPLRGIYANELHFKPGIFI